MEGVEILSRRCGSFFSRSRGLTGIYLLLQLVKFFERDTIKSTHYWFYTLFR